MTLQQLIATLKVHNNWKLFMNKYKPGNSVKRYFVIIFTHRYTHLQGSIAISYHFYHQLLMIDYLVRDDLDFPDIPQVQTSS